MITHLYIKNFALIAEMDINFTAGFSVITGETGAGKSIIIGALSLLLGARADVKTIKEGAQKCIVEALVNAQGEEYILRREVHANGKSRAFINDSPVSLQELKDLSEQLIDIHSQHQNLLLKDNTFQLSVVDTIAGNGTLMAEYKDSYEAYRAAQTALTTAQQESTARQQRIDYIRFQYDELSRLALQSGEEEQLTQRATAMQHTEDIKRALYAVDSTLGEEQQGVLAQLHHAVAAVGGILRVYAPSEDVYNRLNNTYIELKELAGDVSALLAAVDYDPAELERINNRLDAIYSAQTKHHVDTIDALIEIQEKYKAEIDSNDNSEVILADLTQALRAAQEHCEGVAAALTTARAAAARAIEGEMAAHLQQLGLPSVQFAVSITAKDLAADGKDKVEFLFSANVGVPLRAISAVASGGEIARVMLALKAMLSGATQLPTIIFDEIDTGVGGKVAEQMALTMKAMAAADRQVISITHLPQIAARGTTHYKVYKLQSSGETVTRMTLLSDNERVEEIAQMVSGNNVSEAAMRNARELLGQQEDVPFLT